MEAMLFQFSGLVLRVSRMGVAYRWSMMLQYGISVSQSTARINQTKTVTNMVIKIANM